MTAKEFGRLLASAGSKWNARDVLRLGAALAYYALLSMAPLLILTVAICGFVFSETVAERDLLQEIQNLVGSSGAETVRTVIDSAKHAGHGVFATTVAVITLLFGASGVFLELRDSLNTIWDAPPRPSSTWRGVLRQRVASFGMVLGLGVLLLFSVLLSAALTAIQSVFAKFFPADATISSQIANFTISIIVIAVLFALIFKFVPDVSIDWRDVGVGAVATSVLFSSGKALLAVYLATAGVGSAYGAAGSVIALVVWVYYSAQIFFFGAILTRVYADTFGSRKRGGAHRYC
ncbi:MAG: YihY/virulence factor BrkB family protein [Bryobacteraceae bacterium]